MRAPGEKVIVRPSTLLGGDTMIGVDPSGFVIAYAANGVKSGEIDRVAVWTVSPSIYEKIRTEIEKILP